MGWRQALWNGENLLKIFYKKSCKVFGAVYNTHHSSESMNYHSPIVQSVEQRLLTLFQPIPLPTLLLR